MDLTFQVPMQYCSLQHCTLLLSPVSSTAGYFFFFFFLWLHPFILSGVISPLISSSILGTYQPGAFIIQCSIFLPFLTVNEVLKARLLKWFAIPFPYGPFPVDHILSELSPMTCPSWVALHGMAYSFIELDKAVIHVIRLISFL